MYQHMLKYTVLFKQLEFYNTNYIDVTGDIKWIK